MMGSGKTSWAIQEMNANKEKSYIFVTPFLSEIDRIKKETDITFYEPIQKGEGKLKSFHELLVRGTNIAVTHKLFTMINDETREFINRGKYILIIDESLEVFEIYDKVNCGDIKFLLKTATIKINDNGLVEWCDDDDYENFKYSEVKLAIKNKCIVACKNKSFLWQFPPDIFHICDETYIMTYNFEGSFMSAYLKLYGFNYVKKQVVKIEDEYILIDYASKTKNNYNLRNLINICDNDKLNDIGIEYHALSASWYEDIQSDKDKIKLLNNNFYNYLRHKIGCKSSDIMWTVYSAYEDKFTKMGRKFTRRLSAGEQQRYDEQIKQNIKLDEDLQKLRCFIPCNARATNIYSDRSVLIYGINYYANPWIVQFLNDKGVTFDKNQYALNGLIQWVWRSRIRNGEPISIYIPSRRMRTLFQDWVDELCRDTT